MCIITGLVNEITPELCQPARQEANSLFRYAYVRSFIHSNSFMLFSAEFHVQR